jgi:hypothetical protein
LALGHSATQNGVWDKRAVRDLVCARPASNAGVCEPAHNLVASFVAHRARLTLRNRERAMTLYAFDGTWQEEEEAGFKNSNIVRFAEAYDGPVRYYRGIGTKGGKGLRLASGATGLGGEFRIDDAKKDLRKQLKAGERAVDIVGFSRGAALAIDFANEIVDTLQRNDLRAFSACSTRCIPSALRASSWRVATTRWRWTSGATRSPAPARRTATRCGSGACIRTLAGATTIPA